MSFGLVEVITLLLGLSGFGLQQNPKPATPDAALQYAIADADVVVHVDAASLVPGNYAKLVRLADQPQIKASPELAKAVRKVVNEIEGGRGLVKAGSGIDLATDVSDATLFVQYAGPQKDPNFVASVRGRFSIANLDKIGGMMKKSPTKIGGGAMIETGPNDPAIAVTKDGVFLAGTSRLVKDRLADTWRAPARPANGNLAHVAEILAQKPVFSVMLTMSAAARRDTVAKMDTRKNFIADVINRHKIAAFSMFHDGIGWTWQDSVRGGIDTMAMISEGAIDVLRAAHVAPRGFAKIMLGAIDSYKGTDRKVDEVIRRKADIMKIVETYTGDGKFVAKVDKDPARMRLVVRATGKSLSDVLPAGALVPVGAFLMFGSGVDKSSMPPPTMSSPPPRPMQPKPPTKTSPAPTPRP